MEGDTGPFEVSHPAVVPLYAPPHRFSRPDVSTSSHPQPFDENDPRVYFDRSSNTWKCEDNSEEEASEMEWDANAKAWIAILDDDLIKAQQQAYSVEGVDEEALAVPMRKKGKKRRKEEAEDQVSSKGNKHPRKRINTSVYVTGLPLDCTKEEIVSVFSRYGVLYEDDSGSPRVKMYMDQKTGMFKGEALVTYFKEESVDLVIQVLDESALRAAEGKTHPIMSLSKAEFGSQQPTQAQNESKNHDQVAENGHDTANKDSARSQPTAAERKNAKKRFARMHDKISDWNSDSDEGDGLQALSRQGAHGNSALPPNNVRQVCLRRMFTVAELDEDPTLLLDLKEDVREECETLGVVTNVVLWDKEPDGIMTVKFKSYDSALACVQKMDGRFFGGRQIIAHLLEGKPRFNRSAKGDEIEEDEEEAGENSEGPQHSRHDAFGDWLEAGGNE